MHKFSAYEIGAFNAVTLSDIRVTSMYVAIGSDKTQSFHHTQILYIASIEMEFRYFVFLFVHQCISQDKLNLLS